MYKNPPILNDIFTSKENGINLRINNKLVLPKVTTKRGLHSFTYRGSRAWNTLSDDLKKSCSVEEFKTSLSDIAVLECTCKLCIRE